MTYAEIKAKLRGLINRSDMTDALAADFIYQAQVRLERRLRTSFMQKFVSFNPPRDDGVFRLPTNYLELIDLFSATHELTRVDTSRWLQIPEAPGEARVFIQTGHDFRMRPCPLTTDTFYLRYYAVEPTLVNDTDTNQWSLSAPDALLYGAAEFAADYFEDERLERFASRFETCIDEIRDQQIQEDFSGRMSIQPAYRVPNDY